MARLLDRWFSSRRPRPSPPVAEPQSRCVPLSPPMSIAEWLGEDETRLHWKWRYPADPAADDPAASIVALRLCCNSPIWWSMTPRQREVFMTLGKLQLECGLHSLLPNVMDEFLWLARRPWWDAQLAGVEACDGE